MWRFKHCSEQGPTCALAPGSDKADWTSTTHELRTVQPTLMDALDDIAAGQIQFPKIAAWLDLGDRVDWRR